MPCNYRIIYIIVDSFWAWIPGYQFRSTIFWWHLVEKREWVTFITPHSKTLFQKRNRDRGVRGGQTNYYSSCLQWLFYYIYLLKSPGKKRQPRFVKYLFDRRNIRIEDELKTRERRDTCEDCPQGLGDKVQRKQAKGTKRTERKN